MIYITARTWESVRFTAAVVFCMFMRHNSIIHKSTSHTSHSGCTSSFSANRRRALEVGCPDIWDEDTGQNSGRGGAQKERQL